MDTDCGLSNPPPCSLFSHFTPPAPLTQKQTAILFNMLDLNDFIAERGGDPNKIKASQRKRFAPEEAVDEVIALYEEARKGMFRPIRLGG